MTPTATTPAGRTGQGTGGSARASEGHRQKLRRRPAPRTHRRVSGPAGGRTATTPRPAERKRRSPAAPRTASRTPLAARALAFLKALPDHAVIDRLVRGRAWILALGVMLTGIVAMQVEVLKLGANIGRSVQRSSTLQVRNEQLQSSVASLADDQRIEKLAAGMGMVMAPAGSVGFLTARGHANVRAAVANLQAPSTTTFVNSPSTNGVLVTPTVIAAANAPTGSSSTGTQTTSTTPGAGAATTSTTSYASPAAAVALAPATQSQSTASTGSTPAGG